MSPEDAAKPSLDHNVSSKVESLRNEIQRLVLQGVESARFELTRECSLSKEEKKSQADFAKTIQGISNAHSGEERVYVVGADQKEKKFYALKNEREFDSANLRQVLGKYLEPVPNFESYVLKTDDGINFAAIVLPPEQPRPILAKVSQQASDGKTQVLQKGDIWIKKHTALDRATRDDLEAFYDIRIEAESERRAGIRIAEVRNAMEASIRLQSSSERRIPSEDLVFGPETEYRLYFQQLIANQDDARFRMLLTSLRDLLVERWHSVDAYNSSIAHDAEQADQIQRQYPEDAQIAATAAEIRKPSTKIAEHIQSTFYPALRRVIYSGLLLIKHGSDVKWFDGIVNLLAETFAVVGQLRALADFEVSSLERRPSIAAAIIEVLLASRILGTYAVRMRGFEFLQALLRKYVTPIPAQDPRSQKPLLLWPAGVNVPGFDRILFAWTSAVHPYWKEFFGDQVSYLNAACRLEFVLHLNSYLGTENPHGRAWLEKHKHWANFRYWLTSDLWRYSLRSIVPLAEEIYQSLPTGLDAPFVSMLSIQQGVFQAAFRPTNQTSTGSEQPIFIDYLSKLRGWEETAAFSAGKFAHPMHWGAVLEPLLNNKKS